jgi:hypothetical protein
MECVVAREQLAERVLDVLEEDAAELREHLAWCAGCRKEERELAEGAELLALLEPGEPPADLERRVVERVARAAGSRRRRGRGPVAVAVAAVLAAVLAVGWGAAMAGRARRLDGEAELARTAAAKAAREFGVLLGGRALLGRPMVVARVVVARVPAPHRGQGEHPLRTVRVVDRPPLPRGIQVDRGALELLHGVPGNDQREVARVQDQVGLRGLGQQLEGHVVAVPPLALPRDGHAQPEGLGLGVLPPESEQRVAGLGGDRDR